VQETRELVKRLDEGLDVRLGVRNGQMFETFKEQLQDEAPAGVLSSNAKDRRDARERASLASEDEETRVLGGLRAIADRDPKVGEALRLFTWLEQGGELRIAALRAKEGVLPEDAVDRFVSLIDYRFRPLVLVKLRHAARYPDSSVHATHGLILAFQKLAKDFDEFESVVRALGTGNYGARRLAELHRAYGRFDHTRAIVELVSLAKKYLEEVESWEPKTPSEAFVSLLAHDVPETHALLATFLEKASFSGANSAVALKAVEAAARMKSKAAVRGLERAVERELGRIDDGGRARVVAALVACGGKAALPFLRSVYDAKLAVYDAESDRDAAYAYHHKDVACFLSGLLPLAPKDQELAEKSREILVRFAEELAADKKPRKDMIYAVAALLRGIGNARAGTLKDAVESYTTLEFREDRATLGLKETLQKLATDVVARL
jgi:hypothetical protein